MIIKSKTLVKIFSFNFAIAMALFPFILINKECHRTNKILINHEKIHLKQQLELFIIFFYLWYVIEYLVRFIKYRNRRLTYENISFEKEAFQNEENLNYLNERILFAFWKYI